MPRSAWEDRVVGARMAADERFSKRVQDSEFSRQEWGLIMTAVEFDIEHPGDAERARIVADTSKLPQIMPELENVQEQMGAMGGRDDAPGGPSLLDSLKEAVGFGGRESSGGDGERIDAAERLAEAYADELQSLLEERGKWEEVREVAAEASDSTADTSGSES